MLSPLITPHRPPQRVEDRLGGVVDVRAIELGAVTKCLAVQQQILRILQQSVVVHQVVQVLRTIEEFIVLHPLRHIQRDRPERREDFARAGLRRVVHVVEMLSLITLLRNRGLSPIVTSV